MSSIIDIDGMTADQKQKRNAKDAFGRALRHNATVEDVYQIVAEETAKVHEYYLRQIPEFVARMIQDAVISYGLVKLGQEGQITAVGGSSDAPALPGTPSGDTTPTADSSEPVP